MTAVPMIVTSAVGANMLPYLQLISPKVAMLALVASFLLWSLGLVLVHLILACYFWRLISYKLPPNQLLASGFLPLAPLGTYRYYSSSAFHLTQLIHLLLQGRAHWPPNSSPYTFRTTCVIPATHPRSPSCHPCQTPFSSPLGWPSTGSASSPPCSCSPTPPSGSSKPPLPS